MRIEIFVPTGAICLATTAVTSSVPFPNGIANKYFKLPRQIPLHQFISHNVQNVGLTQREYTQKKSPNLILRCTSIILNHNYAKIDEKYIQVRFTDFTSSGLD